MVWIGLNVDVHSVCAVVNFCHNLGAHPCIALNKFL